MQDHKHCKECGRLIIFQIEGVDMTSEDVLAYSKPFNERYRDFTNNPGRGGLPKNPCH
jgi:hypothetical protein